MRLGGNRIPFGQELVPDLLGQVRDPGPILPRSSAGQMALAVAGFLSIVRGHVFGLLWS
jgi:hypothetical protein